MSKLDVIKKLASLGVATGAASLLSQEDAQAAGISTIMKKLGVTEEVAKRVKELAKNTPPDIFEENIQAIQKVSQFKKDPFSMEKLGSGISAEAYDAGDKVVKIPRLGKSSVSWNAERNKIIPSIMEEQRFGPKTKTIETFKTNYQVQDKLTPLEDLSEKHPILQNDEILNKLKDEQLLAQYGDGQKKLTKDDYDKLSNLRSKIYDREKELLQNIEKTIPEEMRSLNSDNVEDYLKSQMQPPLKDIVEVRDLHSGNVGLDPSNAVKVFDTGNFMNLQKENMTPAMRKKVLQNYISSPDKKSAMVESLNQSSKASPIPLERFKAAQNVKKAAAFAPMATQTPDSLLDQGVDNLKMAYNKIRKPITDTTRMVGEKLADAVRLSPYLTEEQKQEERDIAGTISEMALDPINLLSPGLGAAVMAADVATQQSPEEIEKAEKMKALGKLK